MSSFNKYKEARRKLEEAKSPSKKTSTSTGSNKQPSLKKRFKSQLEEITELPTVEESGLKSGGRAQAKDEADIVIKPLE
jgi:hypothetical protein